MIKENIYLHTRDRVQSGSWDKHIFFQLGLDISKFPMYLIHYLNYGRGYWHNLVEPADVLLERSLNNKMTDFRSKT